MNIRMEKRLMVSVCMITYGHEAFIEEAIKGVLMQETDFEIELIIANDCSPDATDLLIQKILKTHPKASAIKYINHPHNIGMMPNFVYALQQCKGKYIAVCEGDDYWTDPLKLQKQVAILESNSDIAISFHNITINRSGTMKKERLMDLISGDLFSIDELALASITIPTLSVVFRNKLTDEILNILISTPTGDYPLWLLLTKDGCKLHYTNQIMAVYRIHPGGIWTGKKLPERMMMLNDTIQVVKPYLSSEVQQKLDIQCNQLYEASLIDTIDNEVVFNEIYSNYIKKPNNDMIGFLRSEIKSRSSINQLELIKKSKYFKIYFWVKKFLSK